MVQCLPFDAHSILHTGFTFAQFNSNSKHVFVESTEAMLDYVCLPSSLLRLVAEKKII